MLRIDRDDPGRADVRGLLAEHLADMRAMSPPESVHALDVEALRGPRVLFWTAREEGLLVGCAALQRLTAQHAEVKSMRTAPRARGRGVAAGLLGHLLAVARDEGYSRVSLETGAQPFFAPARRLYERSGFRPCPPFGGYTSDPNSAYYTLELALPDV